MKLKKIIFIAVAVLSMLFAVSAYANDTVGVFIDSAKLEFDVEPVIIE